MSWQSRLQKCVALSTIETKFITATKANKKLMWMKNFVRDLGFNQEKYVLFYDSHNAIHLSKNVAIHARLKHINVKYHWIRDALNSKSLELEKIHTDHNGSDMIRKALLIENVMTQNSRVVTGTKKPNTPIRDKHD